MSQTCSHTAIHTKTYAQVHVVPWIMRTEDGQHLDVDPVAEVATTAFKGAAGNGGDI